jgi:2-oxoglutarate ferredoxin oxidoreductase subunit beta
VTFNNQETNFHSYAWARGHETPLHQLAYVPPRDEIMIEDFEEGSTREVELHDGSIVILKKLEEDYDPTDRWQAMKMLEEALRNNWLVTGLIYVDPVPPSLFDMSDLPDMPLNRIINRRLRPPKDSLERINDMFAA